MIGGAAAGFAFTMVWVFWATFLHSWVYGFVHPEDAPELDRHDRVVLTVWAYVLGVFWPLTMPIFGWSWWCYRVFTRKPERYDPPPRDDEVPAAYVLGDDAQETYTS